MLRVLILSTLLVAAGTAASADGITVSQSLSNSNIAFEDSVRFEIELQWAGPQSAYLFGRSLNPDIEGLIVRGFSSSISSTGEGAGETTTKKYRFILTPVSSGMGRIEAVTIDYVTWPDSLPGQLVTEPMMLAIADPLPPAEESDWKPWALWGALFGALGSVAVVLLKRKERKRAPAEPIKTPAQQFLDDLTDLKTEAGDDHKHFQTGLHRILTEFIKSRCGIAAEQLSEDQLTEQMRQSGLSDEAREKIAGWFIQAGRDKFSPVTAGPGETLRLEAEIRNLFEKL